MNYEQSVKYIHSKLIFGSKPGLSRISALLEATSNPQNSLKIIHLAGTNGKGSTATFISDILIEAGYKVGLYISPYVYDFKERISVNKEVISDDDFASIITEIHPFVESFNESPTEFEVLTAAAFMYFKKINCDIVVLETGLGGRFDATNVVLNPLCSVITSISLDHTQFLGDTIKKIAFEKCGIIKSNSIVISYPLQKDDAITEIKANCILKNSKLYIPDLTSLRILNNNSRNNVFSYNNTIYTIPVAGEYQVYNCITALKTISVLVENQTISVSSQNIVDGISNFFIPARLEFINENPSIIIDGSHNEDGIISLCNSINKLKDNKKIITILGILDDKIFDKMIERVCSVSNKIITITPDSNRALNGKKSAIIAKKFCSDTIYSPSFEKACITSLLYNKNNDFIILVTGSFTISNDIKNIFKRLLK